MLYRFRSHELTATMASFDGIRYRATNNQLRDSVAEIARERNSLLTERDTLREEWERGVQTLTDARQNAFDEIMAAGASVAIQAGFCNEYERCGEGIAEIMGLEFKGRERDWHVCGDVLGLHVCINVTARSSDEDEIMDAIEEDELCYAIREALNGETMIQLAKDAIEDYLGSENMKEHYSIESVERA